MKFSNGLVNNSLILATCADIVYALEEEGANFGNTKEFVGYYVDDLHLHEMDLDKEELMVRNYYGPKYDQKLEDEYFHYESLRYQLLHEVKAIKYFHNQDVENRKIIIFSNDCISMIQYIKRGPFSIMMVHMRSSDVKGLLPIDLLYLCKIFKDMNETYGPDVKESYLQVSIGSAHYYIEGERPNEIN